ncbi:STN domain-containing protein [Vibrio tritonius]|uniref:STN domain-containing protein n=1 Tax=Vibrio tritonius TaxID=1435069 RepID=UPI0008390B33|nr:STN domain-containing protein [Vibrio tritonius]
MRYVWLVVVGVVLSGCSLFHASSESQIPELSGACDKVAQYNIDFVRFDETAQQLAHATGCFVETDLSETAAVAVNPVRGRMSIRQALAMAIANTPLKIVKQEPNLISVSLLPVLKK